MLATLDPVTGEEEFREIQCLKLPIKTKDGRVEGATLIKKFNDAAYARGANTAEAFKVNKIEVAGTEISLFWGYFISSWTGDVPKRQ